MPMPPNHAAIDRYEAILLSNVAAQRFWSRLDPDARRAIEVVAEVLPFKTNRYVVDHLIDWDRVPHDPIFQLTFPQREMLEPEQFATVDRAKSSATRNASPRSWARSDRRSIRIQQAR